MQAGDEVSNPDLAREIWLDARDKAVQSAHAMVLLGAHKQIVNRILEPFAHISVVVTATDWSNFFALRCHEAADPTMRALADAMRDALDASTPTQLEPGQWHAPYWGEDGVALSRGVGPTCSAARCARASYLRHDGNAPSIEQDRALADRLASMRHMSPFEHQATPTPGERHHNLNGWKSQRAFMEDAA